MGRSKVKLETILDMRHYMKVAFDEGVEIDSSGNYLVNIGYIRVSTDRQADSGYGLEIQEEDIVRYCKYHGFTNLVIFSDDGFTGTKMDRPALNGVTELISSFNEKRSRIKVNSFIVARLDRLGRTLLGTLQFIQDYIVSQKECKNSTINRNEESIRFASVAEAYCRVDKQDPQGIFLLGLFSTLAEYDRDLIVQKLKAGRIARVSSGKWMGGGKHPFGYRYNKATSLLEVVPEEAEKVKEVFRLYIEEKMPPQKISDRLGFKGERIVIQILRRKSLTGCLIYNGQEYEGVHEAIIPLEVWEEAQNEIERRSVCRAESHYLLTGLLVCGECGAKMRYQKWGKTGCKIVCYSKQKSKKYLVKDENCDSPLVWADDVESAVVGELFKMTYLGDTSMQKTNNFINPMEGLLAQLKSVNRSLSRLYDFDDDDDDDVLKDKITALRRQKRQIEEQIRREEDNAVMSKKVERTKQIFRTLTDTWDCMSLKERQVICRELIDRVVLFKDGSLDVYLKLQSLLCSEQ